MFVPLSGSLVLESALFNSFPVNEDEKRHLSPAAKTQNTLNYFGVLFLFIYINAK